MSCKSIAMMHRLRTAQLARFKRAIIVIATVNRCTLRVEEGCIDHGSIVRGRTCNKALSLMVKYDYRFDHSSWLHTEREKQTDNTQFSAWDGRPTSYCVVPSSCCIQTDKTQFPAWDGRPTSYLPPYGAFVVLYKPVPAKKVITA